MKWINEQLDMEIFDRHLPMLENCEEVGQCAIYEGTQVLMNALEMWLYGQTNVRVCSAFYDGHFWRAPL